MCVCVCVCHVFWEHSTVETWPKPHFNLIFLAFIIVGAICTAQASKQISINKMCQAEMLYYTKQSLIAKQMKNKAIKITKRTQTTNNIEQLDVAAGTPDCIARPFAAKTQHQTWATRRLGLILANVVDVPLPPALSHLQLKSVSSSCCHLKLSVLQNNFSN